MDTVTIYNLKWLFKKNSKLYDNVNQFKTLFSTTMSVHDIQYWKSSTRKLANLFANIQYTPLPNERTILIIKRKYSSSSSNSHILPLKTVLKQLYYNRGRNWLFFVLASSKLTAENIYEAFIFGSDSGSGSRSPNNFGSTGSGSGSDLVSPILGWCWLKSATSFINWQLYYPIRSKRSFSTAQKEIFRVQMFFCTSVFRI